MLYPPTDTEYDEWLHYSVDVPAERATALRWYQSQPAGTCSTTDSYKYFSLNGRRNRRFSSKYSYYYANYGIWSIAKLRIDGAHHQLRGGATLQVSGSLHWNAHQSETATFLFAGCSSL